MTQPNPKRSSGTLSDAIRAEAARLGLRKVGIAPLLPSDHGDLYRAWLARGLHGSMEYLARPDAVEARLDPGARWKGLRSAVVVAESYATSTSTSTSPAAASQPRRPPLDGARARFAPDGEGRSGSTSGQGIIARYARGRDYHKVLKKKLLALLRFVEERTGEDLAMARAYVDTGPLLERELARRAGIGWQARNTMLIDPRGGSYFFIGSLLLPFELEYDEPFEAERCGTCTACVEACPTGALLGRDENGAPVMDATRCISYLTIENRGEIPTDLRPAIGNRLYGCDICQEVCPWNAPKLVEVTREADYLPREPTSTSTSTSRGTRPHPHTDTGPSTDSPSLVELMRMTREEWDLWTRGSAIRRAGYAGFKRNVAVAMGNWLAPVDPPPEEAVVALREALEDEEPLVREHAAWALERAIGR